MNRALGALALMLAMTALADAGSYCTPTVSYRSSYVSPVVVQTYSPPPVVINVAAYVPFLAYQPGGFSTYQPVAIPSAVPLTAVVPVAAPPSVQTAPAATATVNPCAQQMARFELRMSAIEAENGRLRASVAPNPQPNPQAAPQVEARPAAAVGDVLAKRCASCHSDTVAQAKGGGYVFFQGDTLAELNDAQLLAMYRQVLSGKMPRDGKLSEEEGQAILSRLDALKPKR